MVFRQVVAATVQIEPHRYLEPHCCSLMERTSSWVALSALGRAKIYDLCLMLDGPTLLQPVHASYKVSPRANVIRLKPLDSLLETLHSRFERIEAGPDLRAKLFLPGLQPLLPGKQLVEDGEDRAQAFVAHPGILHPLFSSG